MKVKLGKVLKLSDIAVKVKERDLKFVFDKFGDNSLVFELTNLYGSLSSSGYSKSVKGDFVHFILKKSEKFKWNGLHSEEMSVVRYSSPEFGNQLPIKKEFSNKQILKSSRFQKKENISNHPSARPSQKRRVQTGRSRSNIRNSTPMKQKSNRYNNEQIKDPIISRIEGDAGMESTSLVNEFCKDLYDFFGDGNSQIPKSKSKI